MKPKIALIILAGRSKSNLIRCFESIKQLDCLPDEIIVVFDMKHWGEPYELPSLDNCRIKGINYNGQGAQPHMRNIAISFSDSDYLWFIDDDAYLEPNSCAQLLLLLESISGINEIGGIAGRIIEETEEKILKSFKKWKKPVFISALRGAVGYYNWEYSDYTYKDHELIISRSGKAYPIVPFVQGTNMVFPKEALLCVKGFDEDLGFGYSSYEDGEVCFAMEKKGYKTIYCNEISLRHLKLPRIGGVTRGHDFNFTLSLIRNHAISLLKNNYPSKLKAPSYVLIYSLVHVLRVFLHTNGKTLRKESLIYALKSIYYVTKGLCMGILRVAKTRGMRIGLS